MSEWGRNAAIGQTAPSHMRYGFWSILLAFVALGIVIASLVLLINLPTDVAEATSNAASIAVVVAYFIVAPLLHATGFGFGVAGLARSTTGKGSSVVGILLNLLLFGAGLGLIFFAGSSLTAFR